MNLQATCTNTPWFPRGEPEPGRDVATAPTMVKRAYKSPLVPSGYPRLPAGGIGPIAQPTGFLAIVIAGVVGLAIGGAGRGGAGRGGAGRGGAGRGAGRGAADGGAAAPVHPCRVAFHYVPNFVGINNAANYPGFSLFTPDRVGGPLSALSQACPADLAWAGAPGVGPGARPAARVTLVNHGFENGIYYILGNPWPADGVMIPHVPANGGHGIDAGNIVSTGTAFYNTNTPPTPHPTPPGVVRQGRM
eukprot:2112377-Prymnesium_polylepis.1